MFGKPSSPSRSYEKICEIYRVAISKGAQASGSFLPEQVALQVDAENKKSALLEKWSKTSDLLVENLEKWNDDSLDQYQLPHPILGKLTIREMLFFTIYHNLRHASQEGD